MYIDFPFLRGRNDAEDKSRKVYFRTHRATQSLENWAFEEIGKSLKSDKLGNIEARAE